MKTLLRMWLSIGAAALIGTGFASTASAQGGLSPLENDEPSCWAVCEDMLNGYHCPSMAPGECKYCHYDLAPVCLPGDCRGCTGDGGDLQMTGDQVTMQVEQILQDVQSASSPREVASLLEAAGNQIEYERTSRMVSIKGGCDGSVPQAVVFVDGATAAAFGHLTGEGFTRARVAAVVRSTRLLVSELLG